MTSVNALAADYEIYYRITQEVGMVKLRLWEYPRSPSSAPQPYLYAVNYRFKRLKEAENFLRDYLLLNGAFDVPEAGFPAEGQVAILPFPTWPGSEPLPPDAPLDKRDCQAG